MKEAAEDGEQREPEADASSHRWCARISQSANRLLPVDLRLQEADRARCCRASRRKRTCGVVTHRGAPVVSCSPESADRDRACERKEIHGREKRGVPPEKTRGEDEHGSHHPAPSLLPGRSRKPNQQG
jgi:hypothetical protein